MSAKVVPLRAPAPRDFRETCEAEARAEFFQLREALGWTQLETSIRLGVARSSVEDWERGQSRLPAWAPKALQRFVGERLGRAA